MDDLHAWQQAVGLSDTLYWSLSLDSRGRLDVLIARMMYIKEQLLFLVEKAGSEDLCRICGGACCRHGKYHFTQLDLLAYRHEEVAPVIPDFSKDSACPYGGLSGCTLAPRFRPMTCVIFNCEQIEDRLDRGEREQLLACEQELRSVIACAGQVSGGRLSRPLLLVC